MASAGACMRCLSRLPSGTGAAALRSQRAWLPATGRALGATTTYARGKRLFGHTSRLGERVVKPPKTVPAEELTGKAGASAASNVSHKAFSDVAFAFDIDGVLYQGNRGIPGAREMLRAIHALGMRYVFLTNGGGAHEDAKVRSLARRLGMSDDEDALRGRVIVSHTPMRGWADSVKEQTVLITGSHPETARQIAIEYGFKRAVTPADLIHANDKLYPFDNLKESLHSQFRPLPDGKSASSIEDAYSADVPADALRIDKILVWNDPRDWSLDIQVIHDLLVSHRGYLGTVSSKNGDATLPNYGWQQDGQPELWISNMDLFWKTDYPVNRFGTGAFVEALRGVWSAVTEGAAELQFHALGKPSEYTYEYAHERLLHDYGDAGSVNGAQLQPWQSPPPQQQDGSSSSNEGNVDGTRHPLRRVYMIGDNPESDIRGANGFAPADGTEWKSILVKTGVWRAGTEPSHRPDVVVDDVVDGIVWALRNEGVDVTRETLTGGGGA
ncbi:HAD-superfamily hydrolase, subfamily IIA, CECR5 [Purpureocillium lilacinum]|uniref:HAD-superfamily hydrolase, subfamily IIA, CECR5 n=1 Tax=Purpureocillium lilacinum TaxID=33203 RepID=A0A179HJJ8_PURLI|nr:HAD-superfamily hydrolase, subfamily IIA, CECR5 [Purpureocillium lilacinum]OAQ89640.1 HAD-superfamily hydrolase, subfamily IIA, CECR5 [Purpureocillium lilacinum]